MREDNEQKNDLIANMNEQQQSDLTEHTQMIEQLHADLQGKNATATALTQQNLQLEAQLQSTEQVVAGLTSERDTMR